jgi:hypothetical protein
VRTDQLAAQRQRSGSCFFLTTSMAAGFADTSDDTEWTERDGMSDGGKAAGRKGRRNNSRSAAMRFSFQHGGGPAVSGRHNLAL